MAKLNNELIDALATEIEDGLPFNYACDLCEVSRSIFDEWMKQGLSDLENNVKSLHARFFVSIKKAYAKFIRDSKRKIRNGETGWQGTAWWLERTNKEFQLNAENQQSVENIIVNTKMKSLTIKNKEYKKEISNE